MAGRGTYLVFTADDQTFLESAGEYDSRTPLSSHAGSSHFGSLAL